MKGRQAVQREISGQREGERTDMRIQREGTKRGSVDHKGTKKRTMPVQLSI